MRNPLARLVHRDPAKPTLRERAASLKASAARVIRRPKPVEAAPVVDWNSPPAGFVAYPHDEPAGFLRVDLVVANEAQRLHDLALAEFERRSATWDDSHPDMKAGQLDKLRRRLRLDELARAANPVKVIPTEFEPRDGTILYEDASGRAHRKPVADWISFMALRMFSVARQESGRLFRERAGTDQEANRPIEDRIRRDLRLDALHDLAFRSNAVFEAGKEYSLGRGPLAVHSNDDPALFALEAEFHAAAAAVLAAHAALNEARGRYVEPAMPIELNPWRGDWMHTAIPRTRTEATGDGKFRSLPYAAEEVEQMRGRRCMRPSYGDDGELQPDGRRLVPDVKVQERVNGIVAAWDQWQEAIQAAKDEAGTDTARDALSDAFEARSNVLGRIRDIPARTLAGLGVKARIAAKMNAVEDMKEEAGEYDPDQPEALPYDMAGDVLNILAGATPASPSPLEILWGELAACDAARDAAGDDEALDTPLSDEHWRLREAINAAPALSGSDFRVKAQAARLALKWDDTADCTGSGSFVGLCLSIIDHLDPQAVA